MKKSVFLIIVLICKITFANTPKLNLLQHMVENCLNIIYRNIML